MGRIFATKPPLFTPQCKVEANWNWFCLSTQTCSFHTERPEALKHKSGYFSTRTLFSYLCPSRNWFWPKSHQLVYYGATYILFVWVQNSERSGGLQLSRQGPQTKPFSVLWLTQNDIINYRIIFLSVKWNTSESIGCWQAVTPNSCLWLWKESWRRGRKGPKCGFISQRKVTAVLMVHLHLSSSHMLKRLSVRRGLKFQECHVFDCTHRFPAEQHALHRG